MAPNSSTIAKMAKKGEVSSPKKGRPRKEDQSELATLKQELKRLKEENEILKKAAAYFASESRKGTRS